MYAPPSDRLQLAEAPNFRDLGGCPVGDGRRVRPGLLFRSEGLNALTDADVDVLSGARIRLVCDLRTAAERQAHPSRLPTDPAPLVMVAHPDSEAQDANPEATMRVLEKSDARAGVEGYMHALYRSFPTTLASTTIALLERILCGKVPVLVHCAAGKDRTGFVCSLILHALGATDETVMAEYLETDNFYGCPGSRNSSGSDSAGRRRPAWPMPTEQRRSTTPRRSLHFTSSTRRSTTTSADASA